MNNCTLGELLDTLGGPTLQLLTAPVDLDAPITEILLYDAHAPLAEHAPGALLLAVGVRAEETGPLVRRAADAGMTGLVVRGNAGPADEATACGLALLAVDEDAAWHHVHLLLASATGSRPHTPDGGGVAGLGDLFSFVNAVAAAVGGATVIEDPRQRILAHSTVPGQAVDEPRRQGILGRQVPGSRENTEQYRVLYAAHGPTRLAALGGEDMARLAVAVRAGGETLGSLWVVDSGSLAPGAEDVLARAASAAALLLLRARAAEELARHQTSDLLRRLLDGTADLPTAAHRLGLAPGTPVRVAAFVLDGAASAPDGEQAALRLLDLVRLQCEARYGRHACALVDGTVYALLPVTGANGGRRHKSLAEDIVRRAAAALRVPVRAGLGEAVPDLAEVRGSRDDADLALRVLGPDEEVGDVGELRPRVTLLRLGEVLRERQGLRAGAWQRVMAHDSENDTDYARTLLCWLDSACDMARAAKLLAIHPNTCRYRLKQAKRHLGIDLDDPDERLVLWLQLRILGGLKALEGTGGPGAATGVAG